MQGARPIGNNQTTPAMQRKGQKEAAFPCIEIYTAVTFSFLPSTPLSELSCITESQHLLLSYDVVLQENNASSLHTTPQFLTLANSSVPGHWSKRWPKFLVGLRNETRVHMTKRNWRFRKPPHNGNNRPARGQHNQRQPT